MIDIPNNIKPAMNLGNEQPQPQQQTQYQQPQFQPQQQAQYQQSQFQPQQQTQYQQPQFQPQQQTQYQQPQFQPQQQAQYQQSQFQPQQQTQYQQPQSSQGISLSKGQKISLSKMNPTLDEIDVCLGWDVGQYHNYDLDSEAFLLGANDKVIGDNWIVFYNQPMSPDGSVKHNGDNKTGQGDGDDEIISVKLSQVNPMISKIVFVVTINDAKTNGYNFGCVSNAFIRVVDKQTNRELVRFNLSEYYKEVISMMVGEIYLKNGEWRFNPIGNGTGDDLEGLCRRYGVNII